MEYTGYVYWIHLPEHTDIGVQGYVGVTSNTTVRWQSHKECKNKCQHLENAIKKYGWDTLIKEIVFSGKYSECVAKEHEYRPKPSIGWNLRAGGGATGKLADSTKDKISAINSGNTYCKGRILSQETKDKISNSHKGKKLSISHKENIGSGCCTQVLCITTNNVFESIKAAAKWCGLKTPSAISAVCLNKRKSAGKHPETKEKLKWKHV